MTITVRKSADRGHADYGWLNTYHTFSFSSYHDSKHAGFRKLRVINEDRVAASEGFGTHPHSEMEIFSYVLSGTIEHRDSMGNVERITRGGVQFTSAGKGIYHSEYNASPSESLHFLQIWAYPDTPYLDPSYNTRYFTDDQKRGRLCAIITPDGSEGSIPIHQDIKMFACILNKGEHVSYSFPKSRYGYIHVADTQGSVAINDVTLGSGDGAYISGEVHVDIVGQADKSEFVFFDLN